MEKKEIIKKYLTINDRDLQTTISVDIPLVRLYYTFGDNKISSERIHFTSRKGYRLSSDKGQEVFRQYIGTISEAEPDVYEWYKGDNCCFEIYCFEEDVEKSHKMVNRALRKLSRNISKDISLQQKNLKKIQSLINNG